MSQSKVFLTGAVVITVALLFSGIYVPQSRLRRELNQATTEIVQSLSRSERSYKVGRQRSAALQKSLRKGQEEIVILLRRLVESAQASQGGIGDEDTMNSSEEIALEVEKDEGVEKVDLPPLPKNVHALGLVRSFDLADFKRIVDDPFFNPEEKELTRVQKTELAAVVTEAKGMIDILNSQVTAATAKGMEDLRAREDYFDYTDGERFHQERGIYSAAERIEGHGTRIFYMYPEEFPEIYEKRKKREVVAETAVRKLLSLFAE